MARGKWKDKFNTAAACRAQAVSLRALAVRLERAAMQASTLRMAEKWDERASAYDRQITTEPQAVGP
jgi:hypothetical protein